MSRKLELWVSRIVAFSSQYDDSGWCADKVIGPATVYPRYGDIRGSWAPGSIDDSQFLELEFSEKLFISNIYIYETYHAGAVKRISVKRCDHGSWQKLWEAPPTVITQSRIFSPDIPVLPFKTNQIRLDIDCTVCGTWAEIDAVMISGLTTSSMPPPPEKLSADLEKLVNNELFSDVTLSVDGKLFYAHRAILATRSDYFRAMFTTEMREKSTRPIEIKGSFQSDVFLAVLHYLYTNTSPNNLSSQMFTAVWRVADQFNIDGLKDLATFKVEENLDNDNVVEVFKAATQELPVIEQIEEMCLNYISGNIQSVCQSPAFVDLPQDVMLEIIQKATAKLKI